MLETGLVRLAGRFIHAGVIGQRIATFLAQPRRRLVDLAFGKAINDTAFLFATSQKALQLRAGIILFHDRVADIGAIKARDKGVASFDP